MSQMRLLQSTTKISPTVGTDALSDIDIEYPPTIQRAPQNLHPKHVDNDPTLLQQKFIAGMIFLSEQAEVNTDEQYKPPVEIDVQVQNPNLLLTSDHEYTDPFEIPSWGGMVVYLNAIMMCNGVTPQSNLYFNKSDPIPMRAAPGLYLGDPKKTMGWIKVNKLKNIMKGRNIDVEVVELPSILESTHYKRELFLIQVYAQRGGGEKEQTWGTVSSTHVESKKRQNR
jgi:hypothetical protein